jgi:hypothetical protein
MTLSDLLAADPIDMAAVAAHLDALDHSTRVAETVAIGGRAQARLFEAASGVRKITVDDFVRPDRAPLTEVVHHGRNSLALFTRFAKIMCRPSEGAGTPGTLWGYNRSGGFVETTVGPGYFVVVPAERDGEVLIDYLQQPPGKPDHWPPILRNDQRFSRFVYNGTQDLMRGVSAHVTIGRASRDKKDMDNWFVLCRED